MENRDYLKMYGEDCSATCECKDCEVKDKCTNEIENEHGIEIDEVAEKMKGDNE